MKIKAIIFDLGRVLIDVDFSQIFSRYLKPGNGFEFDLETVMKNSLFQAFTSGTMGTEEFYTKITQYFNINISQECFIKEWCSIFKPMPGMQEMVIHYAEKMPIGLLSDTDPIHWQYLLTHNPYLKIFKEPVLSFETGCLKPAELCYRKASQSVKTPIEECLFIDDRAINVQGALKAGMQAVQFQSPKHLKEYLVTCVNEN